MKHIVMSIGTFRTGDLLAEAVGRYALALAHAYDSAVVDVPYLSADGTLQRAELRVGWLVDIGIVTADGDEEDVVDPDALRILVDCCDELERDRWRQLPPEQSWAYWETVL